MPTPMRALLLLPSLAFFGACAAPQPLTVPVILLPPDNLLACADEPEPTYAEPTQDDVAAYILDLAESGRDCRDKLGGVKVWTEKMRGEKARVEEGFKPKEPEPGRLKPKGMPDSFRD